MKKKNEYAMDSASISCLNALYTGDEQAPGGVHGDADVVVRPVGDHLGLGVDGGVEDGVLPQRHRGRLHHERHVGYLHLVFLQKRGEEDVIIVAQSTKCFNFLKLSLNSVQICLLVGRR